jgi:hypothetical protein
VIDDYRKFVDKCQTADRQHSAPLPTKPITTPIPTPKKNEISERLKVPKEESKDYAATAKQNQQKLLDEETKAVQANQDNVRLLIEADRQNEDPYSRLGCLNQPGGRVCYDPAINGNSCRCVGIVGGVNNMHCIANHEADHSASHTCP